MEFKYNIINFFLLKFYEEQQLQRQLRQRPKVDHQLRPTQFQLHLLLLPS